MKQLQLEYKYGLQSESIVFMFSIQMVNADKNQTEFAVMWTHNQAPMNENLFNPKLINAILNRFLS